MVWYMLRSAAQVMCISKQYLLEKEEVKLDCSVQQQGWQKYIEEQSVWLNVQPESHRVAQATQVPWEQYALQSPTCTWCRTRSEVNSAAEHQDLAAVYLPQGP